MSATGLASSGAWLTPGHVSRARRWPAGPPSAEFSVRSNGAVIEAISAARRPGATLRVAATAALMLGLAAYYAFSESFRELSLWGDTAFIALVLMPAVFALVYIALPLRLVRGLVLLALILGAFAAVLEAVDLEALASFAKLGAMTMLAFWFLGYFERLSWVALVAALIPFIDSLSVWRGPTRHIVTEQREIFTTLSFAFPVPGENASANLGLPDLLFFALFLAATVRWRLRVNWTWAAMVLSLGATIALAVLWDVGGLPALPGIAIAFLAVNADLIWRDLRSPCEDLGDAPLST